LHSQGKPPEGKQRFLTNDLHTVNSSRKGFDLIPHSVKIRF
jgi:hypothetical protein